MSAGGKVSGLLNFPVVHKKHTDISANTCQYSSSSGETVKSVTQTGNGVNVKPFKTCSLQHCLSAAVNMFCGTTTANHSFLFCPFSDFASILLIVRECLQSSWHNDCSVLTASVIKRILV